MCIFYYCVLGISKGKNLLELNIEIYKFENEYCRGF